MNWIKIDDGVFAQEADNPIKVISLIELQEELNKLQGHLESIGDDIIHSDAEYQEFVNREKDKRREVYYRRIAETQTLLNELKGL